MGAIRIRCGLPSQLSNDDATLIKRADHIAAYFEATQLAGFATAEARQFFGAPRGVVVPHLVPLAPAEAQARYLARFRQLSS
jgi:hypothetical protein